MRPKYIPNDYLNDQDQLDMIHQIWQKLEAKHLIEEEERYIRDEMIMKKAHILIINNLKCRYEAIDCIYPIREDIGHKDVRFKVGPPPPNICMPCVFSRKLDKILQKFGKSELE